MTACEPGNGEYSGLKRSSLPRKESIPQLEYSLVDHVLTVVKDLENTMSELYHDCGVAAITLARAWRKPHVPGRWPMEISRLLPRMLQDIQTRGQLAAGMTTYNPNRSLLLDTMKDIGTVSEVFRLSHRGKHESLMEHYAGSAPR